MILDQNLAIEVVGLSKVFRVGSQNISVLKDIDFKIKMGDFDIIIGPSGSGKSTLLHSILGLEIPTKGVVRLLGKDLYTNLNDDERSDFRALSLIDSDSQLPLILDHQKFPIWSLRAQMSPKSAPPHKAQTLN